MTEEKADSLVWVHGEKTLICQHAGRSSKPHLQDCVSMYKEFKSKLVFIHLPLCYLSFQFQGGMASFIPLGDCRVCTQPCLNGTGWERPSCGSIWSISQLINHPGFLCALNSVRPPGVGSSLVRTLLPALLQVTTPSTPQLCSWFCFSFSHSSYHFLTL